MGAFWFAFTTNSQQPVVKFFKYSFSSHKQNHICTEMMDHNKGCTKHLSTQCCSALELKWLIDKCFK